MPKFREGTTDADCWHGINEGNEYKLPDTLNPEELIVDIGMHIGSFVNAAHARGARRIIAFEASTENYDLAQQNVGTLDGLITLINAAVGRSDARATDKVLFSGFRPFFDGRQNTGGGDVFAKPRTISDDARMIPCLPFDRIAPDQEIATLKIDCEGSEWPILYTAKSMNRVQRIVGEYHTIPDDVEKELALPNYHCTPEGLEEFLYDCGFEFVNVEPYSELHAQYHDGQQIGLFEACRCRGHQ